MIGQTFGLQFHIPLLSAIMLCIIYGIELTSIFNNYFEYKGIAKRFNAVKFFAKLFKIREIEESIEDIKEGENNSNK